jgi:hypothetical protein
MRRKNNVSQNKPARFLSSYAGTQLIKGSEEKGLVNPILRSPIDFENLKD